MTWFFIILVMLLQALTWWWIKTTIKRLNRINKNTSNRIEEIVKSHRNWVNFMTDFYQEYKNGKKIQDNETRRIDRFAKYRNRVNR